MGGRQRKEIKIERSKGEEEIKGREKREGGEKT